ncbi:glycosyltransferase [Cellulomonas soli]
MSVARLPVPSNRTFSPAIDEATALVDSIAPDDLLVVTVGAVNANRHIDVMLEAVAQDPLLAGQVHLWAIGAAEEDEASRLVALADELGLADRFRITGRVTDGLLSALLARADVGFALRAPVLEGQSASVLTQMEAGLPVVVYDHAHYAELPGDAVVAVDPEAGPAGVASALRRLADDRHLREQLGNHARRHVLEERSAAAYAETLREAAERAMATRPLLHVTSDVAARLDRLDLDTVPAVVSRVSDLLFELYDLA